MFDGSISQLELDFKDRGKRISASAHNPYLKIAQNLALELGRDGSTICIDHVHDLAKARGIDLPHGNYLGSTFNEKLWDFVSTTRSWHDRGHSRRISTWSLKRI